MDARLVANPYDSTMLDYAWNLVNTASSITLLTHYKPDGDGVSACAALDLILKHLHKKSETIYPTKPYMQLAFQAEQVCINTHTFVPDLLISLDTASRSRMYLPEEFSHIPLINIDHHISNNVHATVDIVDSKASSACEVLYTLLQHWCPNLITKDVADCILYGILYDTQAFHTQSTSAHTLRASADLIDAGANLFALKTDLLSHKNPAIISLWADVMHDITIAPNGTAALATISQSMLKKHGLTLNSIGGFVNFLAEISGIDIVALLYENEEGKTNMSLRSKHANVNEIAALFGGGGHKNASGALIDAPLKTVKEQLLQELSNR